MVIKVKIRNGNSPTRNHPSFLRNLSFYFTEYCQNTSIHGLKFLGERKRSVVEKLFWMICLGVSLYFCIILIMQVYHKWVNSPVIVTFATSQTPIWKIPFPAVTICPEIKSRKSEYNFTEELLWYTNQSDSDPERATKFEYMSLVCPTMLGMFGTYDGDETVNETAVDFLMEVAPNFSKDTLLYCKWLGSDLIDEGDDMEKVFTPTLTSEGICHTFNLLDREDIFTNVMDFHSNIGLMTQDPSRWTIEHGYDEDAHLDTFPRRTLLSGMKGGLDLVLATPIEDIDPLCGDSVQGYRVILQHPAEIPKAGEQYFRVPLNQDVVAAIKPNMMTTSDDLKFYDPEDRQCYFIEEKKLMFFEVYNQENCLLECLANFTKNYCGCVGFYMPRDNLTDICGSSMAWCLTLTNSLFLAQEVTLKLNNTRKSKAKKSKTRKLKTDDSNFNEDCNCLPSCNSLEFETETSQSDWDWRAALPLLKYDDVNTTHFSRLRIFFKDMQFITSERNQLYGQTDFWANCGGLLGLFTGFSFISLVEILYFLTLRLICNVKKFERNYWSGANELINARNE